MWGKFSRFFVVLLLVLALSTPLYALPSWWPGAKKTAEPSQEQSELIVSMEQSLTALQTELDALKQLYSNSKATIAKLEVELTAQKSLLSISETSYDSLKSDYDALVMQPTVTDYKSPWGGIVGAGATYAPTTGRIGAEAEMGVSYKNLTLKTGVEWSPLKFEFVIPKMDDLKFKAGLQYRF